MSPSLKTILVTGASSGFGKLTTDLLLKRGHRVIAGVRGGKLRLEQVYGHQVQAIQSGQLQAVDLHMEKPESFSKILEFIREQYDGKLDVLINNAGYGLLGPLEFIQPEAFKHQMEVNFLGPVYLIKVLIPVLQQAKGRIINVGSILGLVSFPFYSAYTASKFALEGFTEALYYELKLLGIQVALVEPGGFKTNFVNGSMSSGEWADDHADSVYGGYKKLRQTVKNTRGRISGADPVVVAKLMVKLCEKPRIALRNIVGIDAWTMWLMRRLLPENLRVRIIAWFMSWYFIICVYFHSS